MPDRTVTPEHSGEHDLHDAEHDADAARLRVAGFTYREIAAEQGCSTSTAHDRVMRALAAVPVEAVTELRRVEDDRLDALWKVAWNQALSTTNEPVVRLQAVRECRGISESRRRLHGMDAPVKIRHEVITEDVVDAAIRELEAELVLRSGEHVPSE